MLLLPLLLCFSPSFAKLLPLEQQFDPQLEVQEDLLLEQEKHIQEELYKKQEQDDPEQRWRMVKAKDRTHYQTPSQLSIRNSKRNQQDGIRSRLSPSQRLDLGRPRAACGVEGPPADRIVGGTEAAPHQFPWMAAIYVNGYLFCGGAFISEHYVLTAAHCVDEGYTFEIMAGAHNVKSGVHLAPVLTCFYCCCFYSSSSGYEDHRITIMSYTGILHPDWDPSILANDLALIELPEPLPLSQYVSLACLPHQGEQVPWQN